MMIGKHYKNISESNNFKSMFENLQGAPSTYTQAWAAG